MFDPKLRNALKEYLEYLGDDFWRFPASTHFHHMETGGLAEHVLEVLSIGTRMMRIPDLDGLVDPDKFVMAAVLHDVGKLDVYTYDEKKKQWRGSIGVARMPHELRPVLEFMEITGCPMPKEVQHAILGHMGGWSKTGIYPDSLLGAVLSAADLLSSRLPI